MAYIGGKSRVANRLIAMFPPHRTYIEPFVGAAQVFFRKPRSDVEILNDLDFEVVNFLRVAKHHHAELVRQLAFAVSSRRMHEIYRAQNPQDLTDIQRAARFLYLQRTSFGGRVTRQTFHVSVVQNANFNPGSLGETLAAAAKRLERVQLEQRPYEEVVARFDSPESFFFCDPPYIGRELYNFNMTEEDFVMLAERLSKIAGTFLMTINDCELSRKLFARFNIREISFAYSCTRTSPKVRELVVTNYALDR